MSTSARIGIEGEDGSVLSVHLHWDGYPSWVGPQLLEHFNSPQKAYELIQLGNLAELNGPDLAPEGAYNGPGTVTHHRWRNWDGWEPSLTLDREALAADSDAFAFLFGPRGWEYTEAPDRGRTSNFQPLTPAAIAAEKARGM